MSLIIIGSGLILCGTSGVLKSQIVYIQIACIILIIIGTIFLCLTFSDDIAHIKKNLSWLGFTQFKGNIVPECPARFTSDNWIDPSIHIGNKNDEKPLWYDSTHFKRNGDKYFKKTYTPMRKEMKFCADKAFPIKYDDNQCQAECARGYEWIAGVDKCRRLCQVKSSNFGEYCAQHVGIRSDGPAVSKGRN